jgi:uncharacterized membrane protein
MVDACVQGLLTNWAFAPMGAIPHTMAGHAGGIGRVTVFHAIQAAAIGASVATSIEAGVTPTFCIFVAAAGLKMPRIGSRRTEGHLRRRSHRDRIARGEQLHTILVSLVSEIDAPTSIQQTFASSLALFGV